LFESAVVSGINIVLENFDCIPSVKELCYAAMMRHVRLYHIHVIVTHMKVICTVTWNW